MMTALSISVLVVFPLVFLYFAVYRPWQMQWGATDAEIHTIYPGDELVAFPHFNATRVLTVLAAPEHIFPWIVQMGMNRAGWYSYDWLDNFGRPSADMILPEYQAAQVGDLVPMSPVGRFGLWVEALHENQWIVWRDKKGDVSWAWIIIRENEMQCRLISRVRMRYRWLSPMFPALLMVELADFPMMRKCMMGIRERAEKLAAQYR